MESGRIFCIGKNYAEHVAELAHLGHKADAAPGASAGDRWSSTMAPAGECVVFMKPASCIVPVGRPISLPRDRGAIHHEAELVVRIGSGGANIPAESATQHIDGLALGLDLTLRDLQTALKNAGKPWELAKAFDGAAPLGALTPYRGQDLQALEFFFEVNGQQRQHGRTRDMLFPVAQQVQILSKTWSLLPGDLIYTGTPAGVGPLVPGDSLALHGPGLGRFEWTCA